VDDYRSDYLRTVTEIVQADTFADFLEMAVYLLDEGYKDAAAVIEGSSIEARLRNLTGAAKLRRARRLRRIHRQRRGRTRSRRPRVHHHLPA
jgi:uncharacterized protein (DUF2164 family)